MKYLLFLLFPLTLSAQTIEQIGTFGCTLTDVVKDNGLLLACKEGLVIRWTSTGTDTVLDIRSQTNTSGESGLLGIAVMDSTLYVNYTTLNFKQQIFAIGGDTVLTVGSGSFPNHRGGDLETWNGHLLIATGEGVGEDGIIYLDTDTLIRGLRNPWRIHVAGNTLWVTDVGDVDREEVTVVEIDVDTILHFGWPCYEGTLMLECEGDFVPPYFEYPHEGGTSIIGGYTLPDRYIFADHYDPKLYVLHSDLTVDTLDGFRYLTALDDGYAVGWDGKIYEINDEVMSLPGEKGLEKQGRKISLYYFSIDGRRWESLIHAPTGIYFDNYGRKIFYVE